MATQKKPVKRTSTTKSAQPNRAQYKKEMKPAKPKTYTVWDTKSGKTFATRDEAKVYAAIQKKKTGESSEITETNRKVTHEVVRFSAKVK